MLPNLDTVQQLASGREPMASKPGLLTDWPWTWLGSYKYVVLAPWVIHSTYSYMVKDKSPVEFLYYWLHRALHHHFLYSRYHSHHHSSIVTEPITSVIHPFGEHIAYFMLFAIPLLTTLWTGTASLLSFAGYITYIDFMNNMGHCNFEHIPKWLFSVFPPLKYLMYTPSYHSLHHTQFRTNYSLFMPFYDYIYGTMDKSSDALYESSLLRKEEVPDYYMQWQRESINNLIEDAILEAEEKGVKVLSLGLLNQGEELNRNGALFIEKYPKLSINIVDGSSLAIALVLNSIPKGTTEILFRGSLSKVAYAIVCALCQKGIQVATFYENEKLKLSAVTQNKVIVAKSFTQKVWIVGDGVSDDEQLNAPKGTLFIPFSQFPPKKTRNDAFYYHTPAMLAPPSLHNLHSCENWLPRRVMSAWRVAGIVHALEGWDVHECGDTIFNVKRILEAALRHGFRPTTVST
ncbi:UNVERIFIED_CONTAM: Very-long-chain aldehyde decarbonylase CER1 [Sesamum angustifolium]|uniref:Very-long-chain aldehyde decarbonylase CER1 n=1 Tax=Sesamum angustifolium TaxID=2727405 RepID=A0AAW2RIG9_9LAMI